MTYFMYFRVVDNISVLFHFLLRDSTEISLNNLALKMSIYTGQQC